MSLKKKTEKELREMLAKSAERTRQIKHALDTKEREKEIAIAFEKAKKYDEALEKQAREIEHRRAMSATAQTAQG